MNHRLILEDLIIGLSEKANVTPDVATRFLKSFISQAGNTIVTCQGLEIPGVGIFTVSPDTDGRFTVLFKADDSIADTINAPFALFDAVELNDGVSEDFFNLQPSPEKEIEGVSSSDAHQDNEHEIIEEPQPVAKTAPEVTKIDIEVVSTTNDDFSPAETVQQSESPAITTPISSHTPEPETNTANVPMPEPAQMEYESESYNPEAECSVKSHKPNYKIVTIAAIALLVVGAYFFGLFTPAIAQWALSRLDSPITPTSTMAVLTDTISEEKPDTVTAKESTPVQPEGKPVALKGEITDTVRVDYYFTHMARRYFGNDAFWAYIYEENKEKLGHPEATSPGTIVVIPKAEKYNIDANSPESVNQAKALGVEIYNRFRR